MEEFTVFGPHAPSQRVEVYLDLAVSNHFAGALPRDAESERCIRDLQFEYLSAMPPETFLLYVEFLQLIKPHSLDLDQEALAKKSGHMWDCVGWQDGIYEFRMKPEYDSHIDESWELNFGEKLEEILPAGEPSAREAMELFDASAADRITLMARDLEELGGSTDLKLRVAYQKFGLALFRVLSPDTDSYRTLMALIYEELGYGVRVGGDGTTMMLPGIEELEMRWEGLQAKNPELDLADLDVYVVAGIATDDEFIKSAIEHNVIVSEDRECVHDHIGHVGALIELLATLAGTDNSYKAYRTTVVKELSRLNNKISSVEREEEWLDRRFTFFSDELSMLKMSLGAVTDSFTAQREQVDPSMFRQSVQMGLLDEAGDFYRAAVARFGLENLERLPLLWTKLELATAPLDGYPDLSDDEVSELINEASNLPIIFSNEALWVQVKGGGGKRVAYELKEEEGYWFVVNDRGHCFEKGVGLENKLRAEDLRELSEQIEANEGKLAKLREEIPESLQLGASDSSKPPVNANSADTGDFVVWRSSAIYQDGFAISRVEKSDKVGAYFKTYSVRPDLKENQPGFYIEALRRPSEEWFVPAESYEELIAQLKESGVNGEKLGSEIELND